MWWSADICEDMRRHGRLRGWKEASVAHLCVGPGLEDLRLRLLARINEALGGGCRLLL